MARHQSTSKPSSRDVRNKLRLDDQFQFISIQNPDDAKDRTVRRLARSHAVARGVENKRKLEEHSGLNFRVTTLKDEPGRPASKAERGQTLVPSPCSAVSLFPCGPGPFHMLAAESPRLQALLTQHKAQQTRAPVFTISDELVLQNFRSILRTGQDDQALLSSVMLTFAFATTAGSIDMNCLGYQSEALSSVRQRMSSPARVTSESTLGAILLLAGIDARLGMPRQVQLHMGAVQRILDLCRAKGVYLSDGIKRAIFWQDLNSSVLTGSSRVVDHTTFSELQWRRDPFSPNFFVLPSGFQAQSHLLGDEFVEVLKDIYALQCIRDSALFGTEDVMSMAYVDNHQASIQSRLVSLPNGSSISQCCHLAAYLCSAMLRCKLWRASTIPSHLSLQLFCKLHQGNDDAVWDDLPELLAWLLNIGGAFAPMGTIRSDYVALLHKNRRTRLRGLYSSWPELLDILKQFIWSEKAFMSQVKAFWEETFVYTGSTQVSECYISVQ
ncbi:hypothetical protein ACJZ2D_009683 [Fusarium nematophilum]